MNQTKMKEKALGDVACGVKNCIYHSTDNCCHAERITVRSENAVRMAETFCGTFHPRAEV